MGEKARPDRRSHNKRGCPPVNTGEEDHFCPIIVAALPLSSGEQPRSGCPVAAGHDGNRFLDKLEMTIRVKAEMTIGVIAEMARRKWAKMTGKKAKNVTNRLRNERKTVT